jgi:hypothetical protein
LIDGTPVVDIARSSRAKKLQALAALHSADAMTTRYPDPQTFARFIAKIAYAFAVGCFGLEDCLRMPVLGNILVADDTIYQFVGNDPAVTCTSAEGEHDLAVARSGDTRLVFVRLLAALGSPEYVVRLDAPGAA